MVSRPRSQTIYGPHVIRQRAGPQSRIRCGCAPRRKRPSQPKAVWRPAKKHKQVRFDHKLRRTVTLVGNQESFEQLIARLESEDLEDSILLDDNKEALKEKFEESHKYYEDFDSMMLSVTYREGQIRYSFHPSSLIEYKAVYVVSPKKGMNNTRKL